MKTMIALMSGFILYTLDIVYGQQATCPTIEQRELAQRVVTASSNDIVITTTTEISDHPCGPGDWTRVAFVNMSDSSQQCPPTWMEFNNGAGRTCGRPSTSGGSCPSTHYSTNNLEYNHVCGRSIGYQSRSTDAFRNFFSQPIIDAFYVDGISVTHGTPRQHIWTFVAGITERSDVRQGLGCFCGDTNMTPGTPPPSFVGVNYFCESGNPGGGQAASEVYADDPLWDGMNCPTTNNCCDFNTPPWFSVQLPNSTVDDIEVRICADEGTSNENILVQLLEIYVKND